MLLYRLPSFLSDSDHEHLLGDRVLHQQIVAAIDKTNSWEARRRRLTAVHMVYVVLGLSLYRHLSIPEVLKTLLSGLRLVLTVVPLLCRPPAESSLSEARYRLGDAPLEELFRASMAVISSPPTFHGMRISAIDGIRFIVADSEANVTEFGRPKSARGRSAYPVALVVARVDVYSHRVEAISIQPHNGSERQSVPDLIEGLGSEDLVLMDRGFPSAAFLWQFLQANINFLVRISAAWKPKIMTRLGVGDYLVSLPVKFTTASSPPRTASRRKKVGKLRTLTVLVTLRMLVYKCDHKRTIRLLTNLLDAKATSLELAKLYHERWEIELTFDEIKNHFSVGFHGSPDLCVRSKDPIGVRQELYGMFAMFNYAREIIATAAVSYGLQPLDISFVKALNAIRRVLPLLVSAKSPDERKHLVEELYREIAYDCLGRERRPRHYKRKVKIKMSAFGCKKPNDGQTIFDFSAQTTMADPAPALAQVA